jgi:hypothetical protein
MSSLVVGWSLIVAGFTSGALLGAGFHRDDFLGGYGSWRRRLLRLGHIAAVALGMLNLLFAATVARANPPTSAASLTSTGSLTSVCATLFALGGVAMPLTCLLAAFRPRLRGLFAIPVLLLLAAAIGALVVTVRTGVSS